MNICTCGHEKGRHVNGLGYCFFPGGQTITCPCTSFRHDAPNQEKVFTLKLDGEHLNIKTSAETKKIYSAKLIQDGIEVAGVFGPTIEDCEREINHYAMQYVQDGPVEIKRSYKLPETGSPQNKSGEYAGTEPYSQEYKLLTSSPEPSPIDEIETIVKRFEENFPWLNEEITIEPKAPEERKFAEILTKLIRAEHKKFKSFLRTALEKVEKEKEEIRKWAKDAIRVEAEKTKEAYERGRHAKFEDSYHFYEWKDGKLIRTKTDDEIIRSTREADIAALKKKFDEIEESRKKSDIEARLGIALAIVILKSLNEETKHNG